MKSLKPSMREKKRYLLVEGENTDNIQKIILEFIGVLGMAEIGLKFIKSGKNSAIICVNRESVNKVRACFAASPENLKVSKVSGTLKGLN